MPGLLCCCTFARVLILKAAIVAAALAVAAACSSSSSGGTTSQTTTSAGTSRASTTSTSSSSSPPAKGGAGCVEGQPVGNPSGDDAPACVNGDDEPQASVLSYGCYPNHGAQAGSFFVVSYDGVALYGKPGGTWRKAPSPDTLDDATIAAIGC